MRDDLTHHSWSHLLSQFHSQFDLTLPASTVERVTSPSLCKQTEQCRRPLGGSNLESLVVRHLESRLESKSKCQFYAQKRIKRLIPEKRYLCNAQITLIFFTTTIYTSNSFRKIEELNLKFYHYPIFRGGFKQEEICQCVG